jgi:Arc/MetJ family transcription regulator
MRTTIRLDDELLTRAKRAALERGTTLTAIIEDALRQALMPRSDSKREDFALPTFRGNGLQPGVDLDDSASLLDLMEGRHTRS